MEKFKGSFESTGYIVLVRKVVGKSVRNADGTLLGYDLDEMRSGVNGQTIYLYKDESMPNKYDTTATDDSWYMVQYRGESALFKTEAEAKAAFARYLNESNDWVKQTLKFSPHSPFQEDDLLERIIKVRYFVGMEEIQ